jgi:hypothetical protein
MRAILSLLSIISKNSGGTNLPPGIGGFHRRIVLIAVST